MNGGGAEDPGVDKAHLFVAVNLVNCLSLFLALHHPDGLGLELLEVLVLLNDALSSPPDCRHSPDFQFRELSV